MKKVFFALFLLILLQSTGFTQSTITTLEYTLDEGPWQSVTITAGNAVDADFPVSVVGLSVGWHTLKFRTSDGTKYGLINTKKFYVTDVPSIPDLTQVQYSINGGLNWENINITSGSQNVTLDAAINLNLLPGEIGSRSIYFRGQDALGQWTLQNIKTLIVLSDPNSLPPSIAEIEYYFTDADGLNKTSTKSLTDIQSQGIIDLVTSFLADISDKILQGETTYQLFITAIDVNGTRSLQQRVAFTVAPADLKVAHYLSSRESLITVPLTGFELQNHNAKSLDVIVKFDQNVIQPAGPVIAGSSINQAGLTIASNINNPGEISVAMYQSSGLIASNGNVVDLQFKVIGNPDDSTPIQITRFELDETNVFITQNGSVKVSGNGTTGVIGNLSYWNESRPVVGVNMLLSGGTNGSINTDQTGYYEFNNLSPNTTYTISPASASYQSSEFTNAITPLDASEALKIATGKTTNVSPYKLIAADVSGNHKVTAYDAYLIASRWSGSVTEYPTQKDWIMVPNQLLVSGDRDNVPLFDENTNFNYVVSKAINYTVIALGDVTGNWNGGTENLSKISKTKQLYSHRIDLRAEPGKLYFKVALDQNVIADAMGFSAQFDTSLLDLSVVKYQSSSNDEQLEYYSSAGIVRAGVFADHKLNTSNSEVVLVFEKKLSAPQNAFLNAVNLNYIIVDEEVYPMKSESNENEGIKVSEFELFQNYPNPFNPSTSISFRLKTDDYVALKVFNILGQEVKTLMNGYEQSGFKVVKWDGSNNSGQQVSSGVYIYRLQIKEHVKSMRMILLK